QQVKGSSPFVSSRCRRGTTLPRPFRVRRDTHTPRLGNAGCVVTGAEKTIWGNASAAGQVGCPSGQREQTVNLPASAYEGSNPSPTTRRAGVAQLVEHQPSKLRVA